MKAKLIQIGNSRGVRLPKSLIEQAGLRDKVDIEIRGDEIVLSKPETDPRAGWEESFRKAIEKYGLDEPDHEFLDFPNEFDETEWTW